MPGYFITFEGVEGSGKSTQCRLLAEALRQAGHACVVSREPGGTPLGERIRELLLHAPGAAITSLAELLLYLADRAQHVEEVLRPALAAGRVVLCDRFTDSTLAYQGDGRGHDRELLRQLNSVAGGGLVPDLTLLLDLPVEVGLRRLAERGAVASAGADRLERENLAFHQRVRRGYLAIAAAEPRRIAVILADGGVEEVRAAVLGVVRARLPPAAGASA
ncbi:MAG: dTMP kinase [Candidatus Tectomicrobia bacterium]|nr:dTMP kinase [Candidatus Tectomicrobia bacterium]